jgi:CheY-like chemotaxis protein
MADQQQKTTFPEDPLCKSVRILFIDDEKKQLQYYRDMVSGHAMYSVKTAGNAAEAQKFLNGGSGDKPHLCVMDLGIDDIGNDEFFLLKKFASRVPFIIVSGSMDMERAFEASRLDAAAMIAKPIQVLSEKFWGTLSTVFLNYSIYPILNSGSNFVLKNCRDVLYNEEPETVSEWAAMASISDTYIRKLWAECFTYPPKYILFLYRMYKYSFRFHDAGYIADLMGTEPPAISFEFIEQYKQMIKYYMQNKVDLDLIRDR